MCAVVAGREGEGPAEPQVYGVAAARQELRPPTVSPGAVPSIFVLTCLQAHHLDLEYYDHHFQPGAYLRTHARHVERWHPEDEKP